jgi:hypothetical protein
VKRYGLQPDDGVVVKNADDLGKGPRFPAPREYAGDPPPADGLRQALALATEPELALTASMLVTAAKMSAGLHAGAQVTGPMEGAAALFGWLAAVVTGETDRRARLLRELDVDGTR